MSKVFFKSFIFRASALLFVGLCFIPISDLSAQAPDSVNYQAVARNDDGEVLGDEALDIRISLFQGSSGGNLVYEEEHSGVNTDAFGLFSLYIGGGSQTGGSAASFADIDWGTASHHIQVEIDAGSGFEDLGTRELVSVPYALYAKDAGAGGGGSLQSAYEGGNEISMDTSPVIMRNVSDTLLHLDGSTVGIGHNRNLQNVKLDVRRNSGLSNYGPGALTVSAPDIPGNNMFTDNLEFMSVNTGLFGVGAGTRLSVGITGFTFNNPSLGGLQDSIYGVTGIARHDGGGGAAVGVSGVTHSLSGDLNQGVGVYGRIQGGDDLQYANYDSVILAGGVFDAAVYPDSTSGYAPVASRTIGVGGRAGSGGELNIGAWGMGGADGNSLGVLGVPGGSGNGNNVGVMGVAGDHSGAVGVMGIGDSTGTEPALAGLFQHGWTVFQDTIQIDAGNPAPGEFLKALDGQGTAVWDTVPSGGSPTPITLQDAYLNGDSISLNTGGSFGVLNSGNTYQYLFAGDGSKAVAIGHDTPMGSVQATDVGLHIANPTNGDPGHLLLSSGANNNGEGGLISFSENIGSDHAGASVHYHSGYNRLFVRNHMGGAGDRVLGITVSSPILSEPNGVIIGKGYNATMADPPDNGLLVEDTVGIGTTTPSHEHHVEGRSYASQGFITHDTAEYRYEAPKTHHQGVAGHEFRPTSSLASSNQFYSVRNDGGAYFDTGLLDSSQVSAPLDLPDEAEITEIRVFMHDNVSGDDIRIVVESIPYGNSPVPSPIASYTSTGSGDEDHTFFFGGSPIAVDNENYMYRLRAVFSAGHGTALRLENAKVQYQVDKAD